jgi:hypothetical protein
MMPARITLDFSGRRRRVPIAGLIFLCAGILAAYWTLRDYQMMAVEAELFDMNLSRYEEADESVDGQSPAVRLAEISAVTEQLNTPWSALLNDLEEATGDSGKDVALLEVAPDRDRQKVRISGEARTLGAALDYVSRLQSAQSVAYPLLENHEIRTSVRERPVHFEVSADWRISN